MSLRPMVAYKCLALRLSRRRTEGVGYDASIQV